MMLDSEKMSHKIIVLGADHHNTLAMARIFGVNGIKTYGIIVVTKGVSSFVDKSKYWQKTWKIEKPEALVPLLFENFGNEQYKPVLFSCGDQITEILDRNYDELSKKFILPSINEQQGAICRMMDKAVQYEFSKNNNIPMAKTWKLVLNEKYPEDLVFPAILKPVSSYAGNKLDIVKCESIVDLPRLLRSLQEKGYEDILFQEYIQYDYEIVIEGCCSQKGTSYYILKNERHWPAVGSTGCFGRTTADRKIHSFAERIIQCMVSEGYTGLFDIDAFAVGDDFYLNEINWRNGGRDFTCLGTKIFYPLIWYLSVTDEQASDLDYRVCTEEQYGMDETLDLRHVFYCGYPMSQWNSDREKSRSFAVWYKDDLKPVWYRYSYLIKEILLRLITGK